MTRGEPSTNGAIIDADIEDDPAADRSAVERGDNQPAIIGAAEREGQRT